MSTAASAAAAASASASVLVHLDPRYLKSSPSSSSYSVSTIGSSTVVTIPLNPSTPNPICDVKRALFTATGIPPHYQRLATVSGVDTFHFPASFQFSKRSARSESLSVTIRTMSEVRLNERWTIKVDPNDTVLDLKFLFSPLVKVQPEFLRFYIWQGGNPTRAHLNDADTLAKAKLVNGQTVRVMFEFPSGIPGHGSIHRSNTDFLINEHPDSMTVGAKFRRAAQLFSQRRYLGVRSILANGDRGDYQWLTFGAVSERVDLFGSGLRHLGLNTGDRVGIIGNNRTEWTICDLACAVQSLISVPLYDTLGPDAVEYILNHSDVKCVVAAPNQLKTLLQCRQKCPSVQVIVLMDDLTTDKKLIEKALVGVSGSPSIASCGFTHSFSSVEQIARSKGKLPDIMPKPKDIYTLCYTSGTTGHPKGAVITHENIISAATASNDRLPSDFNGPDDTQFSYLPMAHIYERLLQVMALSHGTGIGFSQGDNTKLVEDVAALKPAIFPGVPRVWQRIFDRISAQVSESNFIRRGLFDRAFQSKTDQLRRGDTSPSLWDKIVFQKVADRMGGKVKLMSSGAAPLNPKIAEFLRICFRTAFLEGYGLTETCGGLTNTGFENFTYGIVGTPIGCCEVKLVDVPDMGYHSTDLPNPRGEIWVRGPNVFAGYYKQPELSGEVLVSSPEGNSSSPASSSPWFATGDVGMWLPDGNLKIIDRKKNLFKLAQGEYIRPEHIEGVVKQNKYVANAYVHGDSLETYLVGIIVPDFEQVKAWAAQQSSLKSLSNAQLCGDKRVQKFILQQIEETSKAEGLKGFEMVKKIHLIPEDFSVESGLLTPTMKLKRNIAAKVFEKEIKAMYNEKAADKEEKLKSKL